MLDDYLLTVILAVLVVVFMMIILGKGRKMSLDTRLGTKSPYNDRLLKTNPFNDQWGKMQPLALETLKKLTKILELNKIKYFICYGTLLGFARNQRLIKWDNDIDIVVIQDPERVRPILSRKMNLTTHPLGIDKVWLNGALPISNYNWRWPFVDIFYAKVVKDKLRVYYSYNGREASVYKLQDIFPLQKGRFHHFTVQVPKDYNKVLSQDYGNSYNEKCQSSNFDHQKEERIEKIFKVKCRTIKQLPEKFPTFVINLERRPDRKRNVMKELDRLGITSPTFIHAVDANNPNFKRSYSKIRERDQQVISAAEIACGLSHIEAWKRIVRERRPLVLVLEDDIVVPKDVNYGEILKRLNDSKGAQMILLGYCGGQAPVFQQDLTKASTVPGRAVCLHAYILTRSGAKSLLKRAKKWDFTIPIDWVTERWCKDHLCFLSTSNKSPQTNYFGHGIIYQNYNLGTNIENKQGSRDSGYVSQIPSRRSFG